MRLASPFNRCCGIGRRHSGPDFASSMPSRPRPLDTVPLRLTRGGSLDALMATIATFMAQAIGCEEETRRIGPYAKRLPLHSLANFSGHVARMPSARSVRQGIQF